MQFYDHARPGSGRVVDLRCLSRIAVSLELVICSRSGLRIRSLRFCSRRTSPGLDVLLAFAALPACHPLAIGRRRLANAGSEVSVRDRRRFRDWPAKPVLYIYVYSAGRPRWVGTVGAPQLARLSTRPRGLRVEHVGLSGRESGRDRFSISARPQSQRRCAKLRAYGILCFEADGFVHPLSGAPAVFGTGRALFRDCPRAR